VSSLREAIATRKEQISRANRMDEECRQYRCRTIVIIVIIIISDTCRCMPDFPPVCPSINLFDCFYAHLVACLIATTCVACLLRIFLSNLSLCLVAMIFCTLCLAADFLNDACVLEQR
jgi:hypothetical protein